MPGTIFLILFQIIPVILTFATAFARVGEACEAHGRDPSSLALSVTLTTVCGEGQAEIERRGAVSPAQYRLADLVGLPSQVASQLAEYAELGASRAYLRVLDLRDVEHIELLGSQVLPSCDVSNA